MRSPVFTHRIHPAGPPLAPGRTAQHTFHSVPADERVFALALKLPDGISFRYSISRQRKGLLTV